MINGMKHGQIAEYGSVKSDEFSKITTLETGTNKRREYRLAHHTPGWESAGSMARWNNNEVWSVTFEMGGAINGRRFLSFDEAQNLFDIWTGKNDILDEQNSNYNRDIAASIRRI